MRKYLMGVNIFLAVLFLTAPAEAKNDDTKSLTLSVYNHGRALINEIRTINIPQGKSSLEYMDVPQTINSETLQVSSITAPDDFFILDMNYEYDLINVSNLLNKYIGKQIKIIIPDQEDAEKTVMKEAVLLSNNDRPIFEVDGNIYIGDYNSLYLAEMPKGLRATPALVWLVKNNGPKKQDISVSYLADAITWKSDYVLKLDKDNKKASISGWVTLDNRSGKSFTDTTLKLVAGDVNTVRSNIHNAYMARGIVAAEFALEDQMQEEEFFEYHLYNLGRKIDILNNQTKQVSLLSATDFAIQKELISYYNRYPSSNRSEIKQKTEVFISFKNTKDNGLGSPLPKGVIRAYQSSSDGAVLFIGEDSIEHTPKEETVKIKMGEAFDVNVKRILKDYQKIDKNTIKYTWQIKLLNSKDIAQDIILKDYIPGDWDIISANYNYEKTDANHIVFKLNVLPVKSKSDSVVEYSVISKN